MKKVLFFFLFFFAFHTFAGQDEMQKHCQEAQNSTSTGVSPINHLSCRNYDSILKPTYSGVGGGRSPAIVGGIEYATDITIGEQKDSDQRIANVDDKKRLPKDLPLYEFENQIQQQGMAVSQ